MEFDALKKIGYMLRFYRRSKDLSQQQMAEALEVSVRNFQRLEMGAVEPKLETLTKMARFLNIPVSSLIRKTDGEILSFHAVSDSKELTVYEDLERKTQATNQDLRFAQRLIKKDRLILPGNDFEIRVDGTTAILSDSSAQLIGSLEKTFDIQIFSITGSPVERWEYIFRNNLKSALTDNLYMTPKGIMTLQIYHHNLNPNPDNPTSDSYVRDISERLDLENWMKTFHAVKAFA